MLSRLLAYIRGVTLRNRIAEELDDEVAFHLAQEIEANVARGMTPAEAARRARADLGGVAQTTESVRELRALPLAGLARDFRYACRALSASPSFTSVAVIVLTLGIGAATAVYSLVDGIVLRGLPFRDAGRLVAVDELNFTAPDSFDARLVAPQNFIDWHARQTVFSGMAAIAYAGVHLRAEGDREPEILQAQAVTSEFFSVLGASPILGRTFTPENEVAGRALVAVISHGLWQRRFGGAPSVIGQRLPGQLADFEILGVMPASFAYPAGALKPTDVWLPSVFEAEDRVRANSFGYRLRVIARLKDHVSLAQAQAQMDLITAALKAETPRWFTDRRADVQPLLAAVTRPVRRWMLMLLGAVAFVLLIACANLATLMLARVHARGRELVIRSALGASRWDLVRIVLVEGVVLSFAGAALGAFAAWLAVDAVRPLLPAEVPRLGGVAVNLRVLGAAALAAIACALIFTAVPALQFAGPAASAPAARLMRANAALPGARWVRGAFVTIEVALAVVLLVGSGLFLASFVRVAGIDLGIDPRHVLSVRVRPPVGTCPNQQCTSWEVAQQRNRGLLQEVLDRARATPGVESAAILGGGLPLRGDLRTENFGIPGRVLPRGTDLDSNQITPDYFRVLRVPLLRGRYFSDDDRAGSEPVVIINEAAAQKFFPGEDPLGQTISFLGLRRIVGIVGNIRHDGPETAWRRQGFIPLHQSTAVGGTLVVRLSREPREVLPGIKSAIWSQFPGLGLPDVETLGQYLSQLIAERRFNMLAIGLLGMLGIAIACTGIYGVVGYMVTQRTQEIGVRMALGARPSTILRSVLGHAATYVLLGLGVGLMGAWLFSTLLASFLFEIGPHNLVVYSAVAALLVGTGLIAAAVPARRASRVDPLTALRLE
jgi:predicted permease